MSTESDLQEDLATLTRLALAGRPQDVQAFIHKVARRYRKPLPQFADQLMALLREAPSRSSPLRRETAAPLPLDGESRLQLVRVEPSTHLAVEPILTPDVSETLRHIIKERRQTKDLHSAGLEPTRSALFVGPPGVGKTLSARWIAATLGKPLLILDLSAVMSSLLGKTGNNLRTVLDYARSLDCVLLLDELDAVAKRRDDNSEIGELKRLVTVLLQEVDGWPSERLLIAATNHPDLLDPAVWRRFEAIVRFPRPSTDQLREAVQRFAGNDKSLSREWTSILTTVYADSSYSDIERSLQSARRRAALSHRTLSLELRNSALAMMANAPRERRVAVARQLVTMPEVSQRQVSEITGVSRDTLRKMSSTRATHRREGSSHG